MQKRRLWRRVPWEHWYYPHSYLERGVSFASWSELASYWSSQCLQDLKPSDVKRTNWMVLPSNKVTILSLCTSYFLPIGCGREWGLGKKLLTWYHFSLILKRLPFGIFVPGTMRTLFYLFLGRGNNKIWYLTKFTN